MQDMNEVDTAGYFGIDHQLIEKHSKNFKPMTDINRLVEIMAKDYQLIKIMQTIRTIDQDKNGFITN